MEREYTNVMEEIVVTWVQVLMSGIEYQTLIRGILLINKRSTINYVFYL